MRWPPQKRRWRRCKHDDPILHWCHAEYPCLVAGTDLLRTRVSSLIKPTSFTLFTHFLTVGCCTRIPTLNTIAVTLLSASGHDVTTTQATQSQREPR